MHCFEIVSSAGEPVLPEKETWTKPHQGVRYSFKASLLPTFIAFGTPLNACFAPHHQLAQAKPNRKGKEVKGVADFSSPFHDPPSASSTACQ